VRSGIRHALDLGRPVFAVPVALERAVGEAHERVAEAARLVPLEVLRATPAPVSPRSLASALLQGDRVAVIAEIKRASPSKGHLAWVPDPAVMIAGIPCSPWTGIGVHDARNPCSASVGIGVHLQSEWAFRMGRNTHLAGWRARPRLGCAGDRAIT
jgi:hypothetical protein